MIELNVRSKDRGELLLCFDRLRNLIEEGYTRGNLMDGWFIDEMDEESD